MDFEQNNNPAEPSQPQPPAPAYAPIPTVVPAKKTKSGWRIFWGIILTISILANIALLLALIGAAAVLATGQRGIFTEEVIQEGPRTTKIAVISLQGVIDDEKVQDIHSQLKSAAKDDRVKGLIIRINSPGGRVSSSDEIYNEIRKYRQKTDKPVVAFMQGIAASGGYYTSVACDKIVAEPTAITGSVGVIMGYFVFQQLLEEKLGILPVIIKSGVKKDWPSPFQPPTEEQQQYLQDKLVRPAYERFVKIVAEGRPALTIDDVRRLADGSIYGSQEALKEKMIDNIGYFDDAVEQAKSLAGVEEAQVVEYRRQFSLTEFLDPRGKNLLKITRTTFYELGTPEVLYLWSANQSSQ
jgi:protease-4